MGDSNSTSEIRALVDQLMDPQTRRLARQKLVARRAVGPLLECLQSTNESVVWSAVQSLEELRASEAVGPLVELLGRGVLVVDVCDALSKITGQSFGGDVARWRKWLQTTSGTSQPVVDAADCVRQTGEYLGVEPSGSGDTFRFKVSLDGGRSQKVAVFFGRHDSSGDDLVIIYSECGPANPKHYETVLRKNLMIPAGAFAIRNIQDTATLVVVDTMYASSATPSLLAKKIENIAALADSVEKSLTQQDTR